MEGEDIVQKHPLLVLLLLICALASGCASELRSLKAEKENIAEDRLSFSIELDKKVYQPKEDIRIKCTIKNLSDETLFLVPKSLMTVQFYMNFKNAQNGGPLGTKVLFCMGMPEKNDIIKLAPESNYVFESLIFEELYFMPSKKGKYEFHAEYTNTMPDLEGMELWAGKLTSDTVDFEIGG